MPSFKGKWVLVTGASAGIGACFARQYARHGANIALVARRRDRLETLATELETSYAVQTRILVQDMTNPTAPQQIADALTDDGINIDILINNAGFGLPGHFVDSDWPKHRDFLELMVTSYAHLTRLFLPGMLDRDYGRIIHVASLAGLTPGSAGHTLYGASKGFLVSFAQSLAAECNGTGVYVNALCPGFTYTEFHDVNGTRSLVNDLPTYVFMDADSVVAGAIDAVERRHVIYVPGIWNKFISWLVKALPRPWAAELTRRQSARFRKRHSAPHQHV